LYFRRISSEVFRAKQFVGFVNLSSFLLTFKAPFYIQVQVLPFKCDKAEINSSLPTKGELSQEGRRSEEQKGEGDLDQVGEDNA